MAVVATGFFDGVHLGHVKVIETLVSEAEKRGEESLVLSFWPHPRTVLQDEARTLRLLSSLDEKKQLLSSLGVGRVEILPFTQAFAALTAQEYISQILHDRYGATEVVLGYDNRMGSDNLLPSCSAELIRAAGIDATVCDPVTSLSSPGQNISSSLIRKTLADGLVEDAASMLGRPYDLSGVVVAGNRLGRTIGFPTANLKTREPLKMLPAGGVYFTRVQTLDRRFYGMTNIGTRPTVSAGESISVETNIFDFNQDIYGLDIRLEFICRIRSERRFESLDALRLQLEKDREECKILVQN